MTRHDEIRPLFLRTAGGFLPSGAAPSSGAKPLPVRQPEPAEPGNDETTIAWSVFTFSLNRQLMSGC
jgi:hypothetical protein